MPGFSTTSEAVTGDERNAAVERRIRGTLDGKPFQGSRSGGPAGEVGIDVHDALHATHEAHGDRDE